MKIKKIYLIITTFFVLFALNACGPFKYKPVSAKDFPPEPEKRIKKNIEEGRGFKLGDLTGNKQTTYDFASSNPLWRASLDILDFMPLTSANYSGGIIVTDWYSEDGNENESLKISIRFLTNEIRSDAIDVTVFLKQCSGNQVNCSINQNNNTLVTEIKSNILKRAARYQKDIIEKNKKENPYIGIESVGGDAPKENNN